MNKDIYHIASDYFSGRISESDLSFLQLWLAKSPENKLLLKELEEIWKITGELSFKLNPDVDAEWDQFKSERDKTANKSFIKINLHIEFGKLLKIAAVIIPAFIILSASYIYFNNKSKTPQFITVNTTTEKKECTLPDGTKVWINKHSNFEYPDKFSGNERVVKLDGEAFFEVVKNELPFKIETEKTQVSVVGTAFNVRAFKNEKYTEVVVNKGIVIFKELKSNKDLTLVAGEKGTLNESKAEFIKEKISDLNAFGWKDETLLFQDTPLGEIETTLSRYFNTPVKVSSSMKSCKFTGEFKKNQLDEILKVISISLGANYQTKNDTIYLQGPGCK